MKILGGNLMLFFNGKSIGYATNHVLTINGETQDTSNKDEGNGDWATAEVSKLSFEATSENFYADDAEGNTYDDLFDLMVNKTPLEIVFAPKSQDAVEVPEGGWTPGTPSRMGKACITSLVLNAPNGEYATYTVTFTGCGALTRVIQ